MILVKDILIGDDIEIKNGDLVIGESDSQHIEHILTAKPGHFYQFPTLGAGVIDDLKGNKNRQSSKQNIKRNLEADNYRIRDLKITGEIKKVITQIDAIRLR